ncbi:hypothetical protein EC968_003654 [Mortierella alpina]|nr:hypothetical protein EC968_003654 [Mortierella alpina]
MRVAPEFLLATYEGERQAMADRAIALSAKRHQLTRENGAVAQVMKRLYYTFAPYITKAMKALNIENDIPMSLPRPEYQVGVRARDGPLCTLGSNSNSKEPSQLRLHDLMLGISRFHILVFVADMLKFTTNAAVSNQGTHTISFEELALNIDRHLAQWRRKWSYGSNLNDGYEDKDLFKVHIITSMLVPGSQSNLDVMFKKNVGEGRLHLDHTKAVHEKYGFPWQGGSGGLVAVRPDSHLGYRVNGTHTQAWEDVDQYFSSVLLKA